MDYVVLRDARFADPAGPPGRTVTLEAGTVLPEVPEDAMTGGELAEWRNAVRLEARRNPTVRLVALRWEGVLRHLVANEDVRPRGRTRAQPAKP